jgi:YD repeat-containing protein
MTTETYPSLRQITTSYDAAGRISTIDGQKSGEQNKTYASQFSYAAHGAVASMTFGNNLVERRDFNSRLQPTFIKLGTSSNPTKACCKWATNTRPPARLAITATC